MPTQNVQALTDQLYAVVTNMFAQDSERSTVRLRDGGVLLTSSDGDHVQVLVQSIHFEPGEELPF